MAKIFMWLLPNTNTKCIILPLKEKKVPVYYKFSLVLCEPLLLYYITWQSCNTLIIMTFYHPSLSFCARFLNSYQTFACEEPSCGTLWKRCREEPFLVKQSTDGGAHTTLEPFFFVNLYLCNSCLNVCLLLFLTLLYIDRP